MAPVALGQIQKNAGHCGDILGMLLGASGQSLKDNGGFLGFQGVGLRKMAQRPGFERL